MNPLGAILDQPLGALAAYPELEPLIRGIVNEIYWVMEKHGFHAHIATAEAYLDQFYTRLIPATAADHSSMWHDLRSGRRTEIEALNGAVIRLGVLAGYAARCNQLVYQGIRSVESNIVSSSHRSSPNRSEPPKTVEPYSQLRTVVGGTPPRFRFCKAPPATTGAGV